MSQLIETICIENGAFQRVYLHEERMNLARKELFGCTNSIHLMDYLSVNESIANQKMKCRVIYSEEIIDVGYERYPERRIRSLKLVSDDSIVYNYKYRNRVELNNLLASRGNADEILIVKNGRITDTSFTNIVFLKNGIWYTPEFPLLKGTRREHYLRTEKIRELDIIPGDLSQFEEARLINSMRSIEESEPIEIANIY